jgi:hypothetical protein
MSNTGIPVNASLILDAVLYKGDNSKVIDDPNYLDGSAVYSNYPGMVLLDTKSLGTGVLAGDMVLTIMWDSSGTETFDILVQITKDGGYDYEIMFMHEDTVNDFGTTIINKFDPKSNYRIIIKSISQSEVALDYIKLTPVFPGSMVSATRRVINNSEVIEVVDRGKSTITGNGSRATSKAINFNKLFAETPDVYIGSPSSYLATSAENKTPQGCTCWFNHVDGTGWSETHTFTWLAIGSVKVPYAPALPL